MTFLELNYRSKALGKTVPVNILLPEPEYPDAEAVSPEARTYKTLYLFHGLSQDHTMWLRKSNIERYAAEYGIAVVMPDVARSWYTDTCYRANYFTFVTEELPAVCRSYFKGMSAKREDNFVAGLSMGGYGAVKAALTCPDKYFACASLSGSLDITRKGRAIDLPLWQSIFDFHMKDPTELEGGPHDLYALARRRKAENADFPKMYLWCGTEDVLITPNRCFHELLNELEVEHCYKESEGVHSWDYWDKYIQDALRFLLQ